MCLRIYNRHFFLVIILLTLKAHPSENNNSSFQEYRNYPTPLSKIETHVKACPASDISPNSISFLIGKFKLPKILQAPMSQEKYEALQKIYEERNSELYSFQIMAENMSCARESMLEFEIVLNEVELALENQTLSLAEQYVENVFYWTPEGHFKLNRETYVTPDNYCIQNISERFVSVLACNLDKASGDDKAIPKCCPMGMALKFNISQIEQGLQPMCVETLGEQWNPFMDFENSSESFSAHARPIPSYIQSDVGSEFDYYIPTFMNTNSTLETRTVLPKIRILENGKFLPRRIDDFTWKQLSIDESYTESKWCIDGLVDNEITNFKVERLKKIILVWYSEPVQFIITMIPKLSNHLKHSCVVFCVCSVLIFLTTFTYALVWRTLNIHGWNKALFSLVLFFTVFLTMINRGMFAFGLETLANQPILFCIFWVDSIAFLWICTSTWLTILNFDMLITLRSKVSSRNRSKGTKKFVAYCAFAFGIPAVTIPFISVSRFTNPRENGCLLGIDTGRVLPMWIFGLMWFIPLILGCITLKTIYSITKANEILSNSHTKASSNQAWTVLKISFIMGFWSLISLSVLLLSSWLRIDMSFIEHVENLGYSLSLFWLFVCNQEIKNKLCQKFSFLHGVFNKMESATQSIKKTFRIEASSAERRNS